MIRVEKDLRNMRRLTKVVRRVYSNMLVTPLKRAIIKDILRGTSPVAGERFPKYSKSYKASIRGEVQFITVSSGKVIAIQAPKGEKLPTLPVVLGKTLSPINLKLSGQMLNSFKVKAIGRNASRRIQLIFEDDVAIYHNKLGAGKAKTLRRLLPTESGERFNRRISKLTVTLLRRSIRVTLAQFK